MVGVPIEAQVSTEQLIQAAAQLPPQELASLVARLLDLQARNQTSAAPRADADGTEEQDIDIAALGARVRSSRQRILGLNQGGITTTADFDAPLPDEFRLGNA
jgi:hypothetical protein